MVSSLGAILKFRNEFQMLMSTGSIINNYKKRYRVNRDKRAMYRYQIPAIEYMRAVEYA